MKKTNLGRGVGIMIHYNNNMQLDKTVGKNNTSAQFMGSLEARACKAPVPSTKATESTESTEGTATIVVVILLVCLVVLPGIGVLTSALVEYLVQKANHNDTSTHRASSGITSSSSRFP